MTRLTERMRSRLVTGTLAAVVVLALFAGGAALAQEPEEPVMDPVTGAEVLQDPGGSSPGRCRASWVCSIRVAQAAWLEQQRGIEHGDGLLQLTPQPYEWAGRLQAHRAVEYPDVAGVFLAEVEQR